LLQVHLRELARKHNLENCSLSKHRIG
jgi:hypothetical protein